MPGVRAGETNHLFFSPPDARLPDETVLSCSSAGCFTEGVYFHAWSNYG